jgi:hypothetical protein
VIAIKKQKRGRWQDYLPKARALHKESVERFWSRLGEMARKESPAALRFCQPLSARVCAWAGIRIPIRNAKV